MVFVNSQSDQVFTFSLGLLLPVQPGPDTISKSVSKPIINGFQLGVDTGKAVIIHPSHPYLSEFAKPFFEAVRFGLLGELLELTFKRFPTVLFHHQCLSQAGPSLKSFTKRFFFAQSSFVPFLICRNKCMSQQLEVRGSSDATFFPVNGQIQLVFEEQVNFISHLSGLCLGLRINTKSSKPKEPPPELLIPVDRDACQSPITRLFLFQPPLNSRVSEDGHLSANGQTDWGFGSIPYPTSAPIASCAVATF